jgi:ribosomal protein L11 methyltransferase
MNFTAIKISTTREGIEPVTGRLYILGIDGVEIDDGEKLPDSSENVWAGQDRTSAPVGEVKVKAYAPAGAAGKKTAALVTADMKRLRDADAARRFGSLNVELSQVSDTDWVNNWKQYYKPTRVGRHVVIVPAWEDYAAGPDDVVVKVDPGAAFGSGTHETTRLCIEFIEELAGKNTRLLDIGTGSGILAVTALRLGAKSASGIDIDELAMDSAGENARLNGVEARFNVRLGNLADNVYGTYGLITANIVADAIIRLAPDVPRCLSIGGVFVASGIISAREDEVRGVLAQNGLCVFDVKRNKDWVALACTRSNR